MTGDITITTIDEVRVFCDTEINDILYGLDRLIEEQELLLKDIERDMFALVIIDKQLLKEGDCDILFTIKDKFNDLLDWYNAEVRKLYKLEDINYYISDECKIEFETNAYENGEWKNIKKYYIKDGDSLKEVNKKEYDKYKFTLLFPEN